VVKARGRKLYDGPVTPECGKAIREGEERYGRKLLVTLHHVDGTKTLRRGERDTAPENRFDDTALGGVRAMMAEVKTRPIPVDGGGSITVHEGPPMTLAEIRDAVRTLEGLPRPEQVLVPIHPANAERLR
jgi:hypothetical protein